MKYLPEDRSAWVRLALLPFKTLVIIAPFWSYAFAFGSADRWIARGNATLATAVLVGCVFVLLGGALVQAALCRRGDTWKTLVFVALALCFGPVWGQMAMLTGLPPGIGPRMVLGYAFGIAITGYAGFAYFRTRLSGLIILAVANGISTISSVVIRSQSISSSGHSPNAAFADLMLLILFLCQIGTFIGIIMLIHAVLMGVQRKETLPQRSQHG